ncbi:MAG: DUF4349 domain-containing protein [Eubacterium sp.]|nr:DUF4349 domain-containing protein [Eubacterium sp.]
MRKEKVMCKLSRKMILTLACSGLLVLGGCGGSSGATRYDSVRESNSSKSASYSGGAEVAMDEAYEAEAYESTAADNASGSSEAATKENTTNKIDTQKLIYRCNIDMETLDFGGAIASFQSLIKQYGGFIESENTTLRDYSYGYDSGLGYYTATVRVPSDQYDAFVTSTGGIGTIKSKSQNVTNVSQEYSDLSVELEVLEAQKEDYLLMLKEAKSIQDMDNVIIISDKIAEVSTSINQIKTRMNSIDNDVAYSYVDIVIEEVKEVTEHTEDTFATRFRREVKQGWYDFGYGCQQFIIWLVANIWGLLLFFGIIFLIVFIIKKLIKRSNMKAEARRQAQLEAMGVPMSAASQPQNQSPYKKNEKSAWKKHGRAEEKSADPKEAKTEEKNKEKVDEKTEDNK